jgi:glycine/D-amino acid oxidase-like deaminating enzyme
MSTLRNKDVIAVIGAGLAGSAVGWHLARLVQKHQLPYRVVIFDRYNPPHNFGSSQGHSPVRGHGTRITRIATFEGPEFVIPTLGTIELCKSLTKMFRESADPAKRDMGREIISTMGGDELFRNNKFLMIFNKRAENSKAHNTDKPGQRTVEIAKTHEIDHELMDGHEISKLYPHMLIDPDERADTVGYLETDSGLLHPERIIAAQLMMARHCGAEFRPDTHITRIVTQGERQNLLLSDGTVVDAAKTVICAGPWAGNLMFETMKNMFFAQRQVPCVFKTGEPVPLDSPSFIRFLKDDGREMNYFYGTPMPGGVKIARETGQALAIPHHGEFDYRVYHDEVATLFDYFKPYVRGLSLSDYFSAACHYTFTLKHKPVITPDPLRQNVTIVSSCEGAGAKNLPYLGFGVAERVLDVPVESGLCMEDYGWTVPEWQMPMTLSPTLEGLLKSSGEIADALKGLKL